ncbi:MAG: hypothetical protein AAGA77_00910 [Bacteroidota bacterium]
MKITYLHILLISTILLLSGCDDEVVPGESTSNILIRGNIFYYDVVTGKKVENNKNIKITLKSRDEQDQFVIDELERATGFEYQFGPLKENRNFQIDAEYRDTVNGITYCDSLKFNSSNLSNINGNMELTPDGNTILIRGELKRLNPFTLLEEEVSDMIEGKISCDTCTHQLTNDGEIKITNGNYVIPSLVRASYILEFRDTDSDGLIYIGRDTINPGNLNTIVSSDTLLVNNQHLYIRGELRRTNPLTNKIENVSDNAKAKLNCPNCTFEIPNNGVVTVTNGKYTISALIKETYLLNFEDVDENQVEYFSIKTINPSNGNFQVLNDTLREIGEQRFIRGNIFYTDPVNQNTKIPSSPISISAYSYNPYTAVDDKKISIEDNRRFIIGPLDAAEYEIKSTWKNDLEMSFIEVKQNLNLEGGDFIFEEDIMLLWDSTTSLLVTITDTLDNGIHNANVYLYNNYDFLLTYQDSADAYIQTKVTNEKGQVYFDNLEDIPYYIFAKRVFGNDTLTSLDPNFNPDNVNALFPNRLDTISVRIN